MGGIAREERLGGVQKFILYQHSNILSHHMSIASSDLCAVYLSSLFFILGVSSI